MVVMVYLGSKVEDEELELICFGLSVLCKQCVNETLW